MTVDRSLFGLATLYADIGRELSAQHRPEDAFAAVSRVAVQRVPGARWASVTRGSRGSYETAAATDEAARAADGIQYELGTGPCVDAITGDAVFWTDDLCAEERWPEFARRAAEHPGVRSMLAYRLFVEDQDIVAGLNLYSPEPHAFDHDARIVGTLIATHGALAVTAAAARQHAGQLERALINSREIGVAMGILMTRHKITRDQAFHRLRVASQNTNRKLSAIATDVADTGMLDLPEPVDPTDRPTRRRPPPDPPRPHGPAPARPAG